MIISLNQEGLLFPSENDKLFHAMNNDEKLLKTMTVSHYAVIKMLLSQSLNMLHLLVNVSRIIILLAAC